MPLNRNALIRYRTLDSCLSNRKRMWTLEDLIDACSDAMYEYEGMDKGISKRTVQADIETMRSGKLGYVAPIIVIDKKYYTYEDKDFTISNIPLTSEDLKLLSEVSSLLQQFKGLPHANDLSEVITRLEDKIHSQKTSTQAVVEFERNENLKGLEWIEPLRQHVVRQSCVNVEYRSFKARNSTTFAFSAYILKEYRNRWFVLGLAHVAKPHIVNLALDRIENFEPTDQEFIPNTFIDLATYYADVIGVTRSLVSKPCEVVLRLDRSNAPYILTKPLHRSQKVLRTEPDGSVLVSINVILNFELEREILGFAEHMEVVSPRILRKRIREALKKASSTYDQAQIKGGGS